MIRNNIPAHIFYDSDSFKDIYLDYLNWQNLSENEKTILLHELDGIKEEETPFLALKRHGKLPPDNWLQITDEMRKKKDNFYHEHPYFSYLLLSRN